MQRAEQDVLALANGIAQLLMHTANFRLPREEHQQAAGFIVKGFEHGLRHALIDVFAGLKRPPPAHRHWIHAPFTAQDRCVVEQPGQTLAFQRGRHQQNFQRLFSSKQLTTVQTQGQRQIGVEAALVKFVENQQTHAFQRRVVLQAASENAFGDHFDACVGADLAVEANAITDGFTDLLAQFAGQSLSSGARGQAARLKHQNGLPAQPRFVEQGQRHAGGFTGAGRRFEHRFVACRQRVTQCG